MSVHTLGVHGLGITSAYPGGGCSASLRMENHANKRIIIFFTVQRSQNIRFFSNLIKYFKIAKKQKVCSPLRHFESSNILETVAFIFMYFACLFPFEYVYFCSTYPNLEVFLPSNWKGQSLCFFYKLNTTLKQQVVVNFRYVFRVKIN